MHHFSILCSDLNKYMQGTTVWHHVQKVQNRVFQGGAVLVPSIDVVLLCMYYYSWNN